MTTPPIEIQFAQELYPMQHDAVFPVCGARWVCVEASTKSGKSHAGLQRLIMEALELGDEGRNFWWVSPTFQQAKEMFGRCQRSLPQGMVRRQNTTELTLELLNGALLRFLSGERSDSLFGSDVFFCCIDESSRVPESTYFAARSVLTSTRGKGLFIGNVKGRKNWFYNICRKAEAGEEGWHYARISAYDAIGHVLDADEIEDARRNLPEHIFAELYLAEPSESQANPFGAEAVERCIGEMSEAPPVVFGIDVARSRDWTVVCGLDADGRVSYFDRFQSDWSATIRRIADGVGHGEAYLDSTGVGDVVWDALTKHCARVERYTFTGPSKQKLMEALAVAIQSGEVSYPRGVLSQELADFEYIYTSTGPRYSAPSGLFDDSVMALALAVYKSKHTAGQGVWL